MADSTLIAWTDHTFNPWMGCHKVSDGCKHCYAETLVKNRMGKPDLWGATGIRQRTKGPWAQVSKWNREARARRRPEMVFCASLADVFEDYPGPNEWRADVWELVRECEWLDFQMLTKRPENIARMLPSDWGAGYPNVWLGTSIEDARVVDRLRPLTQVPAVVHFVSYEPAIGPFAEAFNDSPYASGIEWMIVGGESGPGHRKLDPRWAEDMQAVCSNLDIAFFFKQDSGHRTELRIDLLGDVYRDYPEHWVRPNELSKRIDTPTPKPALSMPKSLF